MNRKVLINCLIIILIWAGNRAAYSLFEGNTSLVISGITLIIGCLLMWMINHEYK